MHFFCKTVQNTVRGYEKKKTSLLFVLKKNELGKE